MTDNEIIKALEQFKSTVIIRKVDMSWIITIGDVLDLIKRQKAEIDDLKRDTIPKLKYGLERANKYGLETDKENEQLKAEIERLTGDVTTYKIRWAKAKTSNETAKSEARKELKYRIKNSCRVMGMDYCEYYIKDDIDRVLEEMENTDE